MSRRKAADLRKQAKVEGTYGSFTPNVGGWDPAWDEPRKMYMLKPNKGHRNERTRAKRFVVTVVVWTVVLIVEIERKRLMLQ